MGEYASASFDVNLAKFVLISSGGGGGGGGTNVGYLTEVSSRNASMSMGVDFNISSITSEVSWSLDYVGKRHTS